MRSRPSNVNCIELLKAVAPVIGSPTGFECDGVVERDGAVECAAGDEGAIGRDGHVGTVIESADALTGGQIEHGRHLVLAACEQSGSVGCDVESQVAAVTCREVPSLVTCRHIDDADVVFIDISDDDDVAGLCPSDACR